MVVVKRCFMCKNCRESVNHLFLQFSKPVYTKPEVLIMSLRFSFQHISDNAILEEVFSPLFPLIPKPSLVWCCHTIAPSYSMLQVSYTLLFLLLSLMEVMSNTSSVYQ